MTLNDSTCQKLAMQYHEKLAAFSGSSFLVQLLLKCAAHCPGLTMQGFQPAADCATDTLMGNTELVYAVGADAQGACSVIIKPMGVNTALVAPCALSPAPRGVAMQDCQTACVPSRLAGLARRRPG